jgi:acyl transferase domain-containing protein
MTDLGRNSNAIAIIGMAGRFPGAKNIDELWQLLKSGKNSLTPLADAELAAAGVSPALIANENYVKSCMKLEGFDRFDAGFFGYSPRQATSMDPQARVFLECAWESLEHAGYDPAKYDGTIGIFAGSGTNSYLYSNLQEIIAANGGNWHQTTLDGEKDFLTARVSYKLGLNGPSVAVQSACSTSLVAIHLACQSLLTFESDIALAGGVSIKLNQHGGYLYEEGGINSIDGICRAYDAKATGAVAGSGCGIVVLKRLEEAIADGDEIHAVIRSTAVNNDGADKAGFSAPGVKAQTRLINAALAFADLQSTDIGMVEGHGTGTVLGDAVELTALSEAFDIDSGKQHWCALGSVKSNIGHLDTAAGVAGLIKAVLCLKHRHFVPSINFTTPNPALESANSPFFVNTTYTPWHSPAKPRRVGVSAFGMGGTNAHAIIEEAPSHVPARSPTGPFLFPLSAHTGEALQQLCSDLAHFLELQPQLDLADVAYTLQTGRRRFAYRRAIVAATHTELVRALREPPSSPAESHDGHTDRPVIFMFPGQGAQLPPGVVRALYDSEPFFRAQIDDCAALFAQELGFDVRSYICQAEIPQGARSVSETQITQPVVFSLGYSLARLWMHWGMIPACMIGHSAGEYVAACVSGVLSLQDCVGLLATRATLVQAQKPGAMLAVRLTADECRPLLNNTLSIAAINSPTQCVISGSHADVDAVACVLAAKAVEHRRLPVSHALHSCLMDPAVPALLEAAARCHFSAPQLPYVSCVTGTLAAFSDVGNPQFWSRHLRQPVQFQRALAEATAGGCAILLEVGSGQGMCGLARQQFGASSGYSYFSSLTAGAQTDKVGLLQQLGRLWCAGARVDWKAAHGDAARRRVGLVPYPFQRQRYWIQSARHQQRPPDELRPSQPLDREVPEVEAHAAKAVGATDWTGLEASIVELWSDVLGGGQFSRTDTFMSLGGDSLSATRLIARISEEYGVKISQRVLISASGTVAALAGEIAVQLASVVDELQLDECEVLQ